MPDVIRFSIVVPMKNEAGNIAALVDGIGAACAPLGPFELIVVNDGSTDGTEAAALSLAATRPWLRVLRHERSGGQSAAVHSGVRAARGPVIATLDGDGQNPPDQLPLLLAPLLAADAAPGLALVAGQRQGRQDTLSKRLASRLANALRARVLRDGTRDTGCGLKAFRREAYLDLPFFNHQHRYLPALFARDGWQIAHVDVTHRPRQAGISNYNNLQRALVGIHDLIGVAWLLRRRKTVRPVELTTPTTGPAPDAQGDMA
ncbi:glycosyltransferase family 2 protein [Halodurantibacterium flavum]|uniref:Glycosyltransferase family 2 protein n=1 Tax=Halodurantibacterium flavum TaxID=1382802 RepID=A0ABW4S6U3_9RHOB